MGLHSTSVFPQYKYICGAHGMYGMKSSEHLLLQFVLCTCNEQDPEFVMNLTFDGAMDIIQQAGVQVTEFTDELYDDDDFD